MSVSSTYGVHSEVGRLRKVLVCAPGLAHRRLTPSNNDELLFDGCSLAIDGAGEVRARGREFAEDLVIADIDLGTGAVTGTSIRLCPLLE